MAYLLLASTLAATAAAAPSSLLARASFTADTLATCRFLPAVGLFDDLVWQSGSTLESLANLMFIRGGAAASPSRWEALLNTSFEKTPVIVDHCFDDHQWWLLGWARAYEATLQVRFLERAAAIFEFIAADGWNVTTCGGGVTWCPPPTGPVRYARSTAAQRSNPRSHARHPFPNSTRTQLRQSCSSPPRWRCSHTSPC